MPQHTNAPFGDIFQVSSPYVDRATQQLREDEKNRILEKQKRDDALDNEFKTILPGVRSADTSKLADLWGDYKTSWIDLQKNPPKKQADYLQKQRDLLVKKAAVYQWVNGSKDFAERKEKPMASEIVKDKTGRFIDQAHDYMMQGLRLPYDQQLEVTDEKGQKSKIDWTDPDALKRHVDTKSVMDAIKFATGKDEKYSGDKYKEKPNDLQYVQPEITVKNNPIDFYSAMTQAAVKNPIDFLNTLPHPTEAEYFETEKKYNEIDPKIKKMWRMSEGRYLPNDDNLTDLERAIKYQAMTYALNPNNQPQVKVKPVTDLTLKDNIDQQQALERIRATDANTMKHISFSHSFKNSEGKAIEGEEFAQALTDAVKEGDTDKIQTLFHQLKGGNGKYNDVQYVPAKTNFLGIKTPAYVTVMTNEKEYDSATKRYTEVIQPTQYIVDDKLIDNMRGLIVHTVGKTAQNTKKVLSTPKNTSGVKWRK